MAGEYDHLRHVNIPKATPQAAASAAAKPAPRLVQVDVKAIEATGFAKGFKAATVRAALIMGSPIVRGNEEQALKLLALPEFITMSAKGFLTSFASAMEQKGMASWPSVIAKNNARRGL